MSPASQPQSWNLLAKTAHWLTVLLIAVEVPVGLLMAATFGPAFTTPQAMALHRLLEQFHHTLGFSLLALVILRLAWRLTQPTPASPTGLSPLTRGLARISHATLYLLLFLIPLSGWAALSVLGDTKAYGHFPIWLFGTDGLIPPLVPQRPINDPFGYEFYAKAHRWLLLSGGALLTLHVLAALWHHFGRRDAVLRRIWPLAD